MLRTTALRKRSNAL